jgi:hypothetical protein
MNLPIEKLKHFLQEILDGSIGDSELTSFVHLSRSIIESHLRSRGAPLRQLLDQQGISLIDLAYDCIAEAFARGRDGTMHHIQSFNCSLVKGLQHSPDLEVFLAYKSFLTKVADAQIARLYAAVDPSGARIHRNTRDGVKKSRIFKLKKDFRGLVLYPVGVDPLDDRDPPPHEDLETLFLSRVSSSASIPELLKELHRVLTKQNSWRRSTPLLQAVSLFKQVYRGDGTFVTDSDDVPPPLEGLSGDEIEEMRMGVERAVKERIAFTYYAHGKITKLEAEAMCCAIRDLTSDWCSGTGDATSLQDYLDRYLTIDDDTYESSYRVKMEYMSKLAKTEFTKRLMKEL